MIQDELSDIDHTTLSTKTLVIVCFYRIPATAAYLTVFPCGINATPTSVRASLSLTVSGPFLTPFTRPITGEDGITILAGATMRYVGR